MISANRASALAVCEQTLRRHTHKHGLLLWSVAIDSVRRLSVCVAVCIAEFRSVLYCVAAVSCVGSALLCVERAVATVRLQLVECMRYERQT